LPTVFAPAAPAIPATTGAEDDRRDDHPDQLDEAVAERLHRRAGSGPDMSDEDAGHGRDQDLAVEGSKEAHVTFQSSDFRFQIDFGI
jgi:hypothetical protein